GANPRAETSAFGLPRARALYGPLPEQLQDPQSFASQMKGLLAARKKFGVAEGELLAVPEPSAVGLCVLVLKLPEHPLAVTVLNFAREDAEAAIDLMGTEVPAGDWADIQGGQAGATTDGGRLRVRVPALTGTTLVPVP